MASTSTNRPAARRRGRLAREGGDGRPAARRLASRQGRFGAATGVQVLACGAYAPAEVVRNEDLASLGYDADWIVQRTGILERRRAAAEEATSDLAYAAARRCLEAAGEPAEQVDLILVATATPDHAMPSTACQLQARLGAAQAAAMDINAACAGFMYALVTGMQFIQTGASRRTLVVGADVMTRVVNPADKKTFPLFGDGAGAVLLGAGSAEQGLLAYTLGADGEGAELLIVPAGGTREPSSLETVAAERHYLRMDGRAVFKWAVRLLADTVRQVVERAGLTAADVSLLVFHQANIRIIDAVANELGLAREQLMVNLDRYGNTSAASIPLALDEAQRAGRIARGDRLVLCGFGAGLAWGAAVLKW